MAITPVTLVRHELIGLHAKVLKSTNQANVGMEGRITDESFKTVSIRVDGKEKKVFKENVVLLIELPTGQKVQVEGKLLLGRPWERIKKKFPKY